MSKEFNITGTCIPEMHYMVNISEKLRHIIELIEKKKYFTINKPRQYGKTTTQYLLEKELKKREDYLVIRISFEGIGDDVFKEETSFSKCFIEMLAQDIDLFDNNLSQFLSSKIEMATDLKSTSQIITQLIIKSGKKIVLMIDEVDKSSNNQLFLSFLGTLRTKYLLRNEGKDFT
ncbi:MAG: AAA family ATPase, partial [Bacteroidia bacterium]|nr:AAA family ATPase [Bacteroidia bacterium]